MAPTDAAAVETHIFEGNRAALQTHQPEVVSLLDTAEITSAVRPAIGRDGSPTFQITDDAGRARWFGDSSMPTISAPQIVASFGGVRGNMLLSGVGTGAEVELLAARGPAHQALLVYESDARAVKLALHLRDLRGPIAACRLMFIIGDDVARCLCSFFGDRTGFDFPAHVLPLPSLSPPQRDRFVSAVEQAARQVGANRQKILEGTVIRLRDRTGHCLNDTPRVVLLSVDARPEALELAGQLRRQLTRMAWPAALCVPDRPDRCHPLARLGTVADHRPDLVMLLNGVAGHWFESWPRDQPVVSWIWPGVAASTVVAEGAGPDHLVLVATPALREELADTLDRGRMDVLEIGIDTDCFAPTAANDEDRQRWACDVAVLADAADVRAETAGVSLQSHHRLWAALQEVIERRADTYRAPRAGVLLEQAMERSGVRLKDRDNLAVFDTAARTWLGRTLVIRAAIRRLRDAGLVVRVWGRNWELHQSIAPLWQGEIPGPDERHRVFNAGKVVVSPYADASAVQLSLEAAAGGAVPLLRTPDEPWARRQPRLGTVLDMLPCFRRFEQMCARVRSLAADPARREVVHRARELIVRNHSLEQRLCEIRDRLRQGPGGE